MHLSIQFLISLGEPLRDLFYWHFNLKGSFHRPQLGHFHFHGLHSILLSSVPSCVLD
ncbi:protein of unknown function [Nitrospira japonica]|uniref:Uncharacterized protein n=1 Tax=Nitrospira japonica TaxID=1325564 RepID=A0A1W1I3F1_9BACT|nr:protein of unknown function [Nitrospira japonica]